MLIGQFECAARFANLKEFPLDSNPKACAKNGEILDCVFCANGDIRIVEKTTGDRDMRPAVRSAVARPAKAEADFVVVEDAVFDGYFDVVLKVQRGGVADLAALGKTMEEAIADGESGTGIGGFLFGIEGVFAGLFTLFETGGIGRKRRGEQVAVFDQNLIPWAASRIKLQAIAGDVTDFAIADR